MKHILTTLMLCVSSLSFSQDTLQIPALELEEFFLALDTLETQDSIKTILIKQLEKQIELHLELNDHNESILSYKDQEIEYKLTLHKITFKWKSKITEYKKNIKSRDSTGSAEKYELVIIVNAIVQSELTQPKKLIFEEKFIMNKFDDPFEEKNYEKVIKENFSDIILDRIILYLFKL